MELTEKLAQLYAFTCAESSLYLDSVTVAPKNTAEGRGVALSILAGEHQKLLTAPETKALLDELAAEQDRLDPLHKREVELLRRECEKMTRIPAEEYMAYTELTNRASDVWHKAKENNDFASFCPILQELVDYNRKFAVYYDAEKAPYDALLNEYERGVDSKQLDAFFDTLREGIVPLIRDGAEASPHDVLHFDFERQWAVRRGDWKLICNAIDVLPNDRNKTLEGLYLTNLKIDRTESENLIDRYPEKAQELLALRRAYEASLGKDKE